MTNKFDHRSVRSGTGQFDGGYGSSKRVDIYETRGLGPWWIYAAAGCLLGGAILYMILAQTDLPL